jgi:hypothetical protein
LLNKLWSQFVQVHFSQILQLVFPGQWSDHCAAVAFFEKAFKKPPNSIFLFNTLREALLVSERFLEILLTRDRLLFRVNKLQCEVTDYPHETGEVLGVLFGISLLFDAARLNLNVFGQVDNETELLEGVFINTSYAVVYEKTSEKNCQRKNPHIVVGVFV